MTRLSLGLFYHPHLAETILDHDNDIDHLAIADAPHPNDQFWPDIRQRFTLLVHDYLGQLSEPWTIGQLDRARTMVEQYQSPWVAEHLQRIHPTLSGDGVRPDPSLDYVFPPLYTEDLLHDYVENVRVLQDHLRIPLAIEPIPTYLQVDLPQLSEAAFLHRLCEESECFLILDIPHAMISAQTYGQDPASFLLDLPLDRVIEIHVAGLAFNADLERPWIAPIPPDTSVLELAERTAARAPRLRAVTFDAFSPTLRADTLLQGLRLLRERFS